MEWDVYARLPDPEYKLVSTIPLKKYVEHLQYAHLTHVGGADSNIWRLALKDLVFASTTQRSGLSLNSFNVRVNLRGVKLCKAGLNNWRITSTRKAFARFSLCQGA